MQLALWLDLRPMQDLRILSDLSSVPQGANCAIIIRHGDRDGAMNQIIYEDQCLNETGQKRSEQLGISLRRFSEMRCFSSPVGRCIDTCEHISKGFGSPIKPSCTELLGMTAPFMKDPYGAYGKMKELGLLGFVQSYIDDKIDRSIVLPCPDGMTMMLSYVIEKLDGMNGGVGVFVTHDMIITPGMAFYFGYDFKVNGLAPFLDGLVFFEHGSRYYVQHNSVRYEVDATGKVLR